MQGSQSLNIEGGNPLTFGFGKYGAVGHGKFLFRSSDDLQCLATTNMSTRSDAQISKQKWVLVRRLPADSYPFGLLFQRRDLLSPFPHLRNPPITKLWPNHSEAFKSLTHHDRLPHALPPVLAIILLEPPVVCEIMLKVGSS
jgi:hypothetical protein